MRRLVSGTQRIDQYDMKIGPDKRKVVVAAVPDDDIGSRFREPQDALVIHARVHDVANSEVRLEFLALFDRACRGVQVRDRGKPLNRLALEVAVGHRMPDHPDAQAAFPEPSRQPARGLRLAAAGPHRVTATTGTAATSMVRRGPGMTKSAPLASARKPGHHLLVGDVAVGEGHLVHAPRRRRARRGLVDLNPLRVRGPASAGG
jgi:hypothetical protein